MKITLSKKAVKTLKTLDSRMQVRLWEAFKKVPDGDIKRLTDQGHSTYRLRVGGWRILFSYPDKDTVFIEKISPRGDAYKGV